MNLPITNVPGELNPADLMTKRLGGAKTQSNVNTLQMEFRSGWADKVAQLHSVDRTCATNMIDGELCKPKWDAFEDMFADKRGGDTWRSKGSDGVWARLYLTPRRSLFTPYKVAKGPSSAVRLNENRFTKGVMKSGQTFEFHDNWQESKSAHRILEEPWVGITLFTVKGEASLLDVQLRRGDAEVAAGKNQPKVLRWADVLEE